MKKFSFMLVGFALLVGLTTPTWADEVGPNPQPKVDLSAEYYPVTFSGGSNNNSFNLSGSLSALKLRGEYTFDDYIRAGVYFTTTIGSGSLNVNNVGSSNSNYNDLEIFGRVPLNIFSLSEQTPLQKKPSCAYFFAAYKNTQLTTNVPTVVNGVFTNVNTTIVNGSGFGGGLGFDTAIDKTWGIGGEAGFYPSQNFQSAANAFAANVGGVQQVTYTELIYRLNVHGRFGDKNNWGGSLGFQGGSQTFQNATIGYNGLTAGVDLKF